MPLSTCAPDAEALRIALSRDRRTDTGEAMSDQIKEMEASRRKIDLATKRFNEAVADAYRFGLRVTIRPAVYSNTDQPFLHRCEVVKPL